MWISKDDNSFNFVAPEGAAEQVNEVNFPYIESEVVTAADTIDLTANFAENVKDLGTLTGDTTINVTPNADLKEGAKLYLKMTNSGGAGDVVTLGTGFTAANQTLAAGKSYMMSFIYTGGNFVMISNTQLD